METAQLWYYQDSTGQEQGPHPAAGMRQWYDAGYFAGVVNVAASYYGVSMDRSLSRTGCFAHKSSCFVEASPCV